MTPVTLHCPHHHKQYTFSKKHFQAHILPISPSFPPINSRNYFYFVTRNPFPLSRIQKNMQFHRRNRMFYVFYDFFPYVIVWTFSSPRISILLPSIITSFTFVPVKSTIVAASFFGLIVTVMFANPSPWNSA
jgi:hypothetical protein